MKSFKCIVAVLGLVCCLSTPGHARAAEAAAAINVDIQPQPLDDALSALGAQSGLQIVFMSEVGKGLKSPRLQGKLTPREALTQLLANSGLKFEFINERTVSIRLAKESGAAAGPADQMRLAMGAEGGEKTVRAAESEVKADVVVAGQRDRPVPFSTANLDLTRTEDDALPFQVFDARDIELSGAADLQDFIQNRLTQSFTPYLWDEITGLDREAHVGQVDMRGWGPHETVVLLNGRRMGAQYQATESDNTNPSPNLRGIPLASIERIEILPSAGSAIYGVGATGGVINIITRRDYRGGQLAMNYETPAVAHVPRRGMNLSYGMPLKWGLGLRLTASYNDSEPLRAEHRADVSVSRFRQLAMERDPGRLISRISDNPYLTGVSIIGATPNIRSGSTTGNLFSGLPGVQASNFTFVPVGSTGNSPRSDYRPGEYNLDLAEGTRGGALAAKGSTLGAFSTNTNFHLGIEKSFGERWHLTVEAGQNESEVKATSNGGLVFSATNPLASTPRIPAAAPTNPFGQALVVSLVDPALDRRELRGGSNNTNRTLSSTLRGSIGEWRGFLDLSYSENRNRHFTSNFHEPAGGWTAAFLSGAYNPFVDPRVAALAAPEFYEDYIAARWFYSSATRSYGSTIKASGPLLEIPAGAVQLTAGVDWWRTDRYRSDSYGQYQDGVTGQPRVPVGSTSTVISAFNANPSRRFTADSYAGYAEATMPVISAAHEVPLVERLELFGSGRLNYMVSNGFRSQSTAQMQNGVPPEPVKYTNTSSLYALGLRYDMLEGVAFRASQSIGFRPPSMDEITPAVGPPGWPVTGLNDPLRPGEGLTLEPMMYVTGGNPDLKPETTDSINLGLILTPRRVPGLRLSVDYLESVRNDAIFSLGAQEAIQLESELPGLVQRGPADGHPGGVGPITFVDLRNINLNKVIQKGVDFSVQQEFQEMFGGRLILTAAVTKNLTFKVQTSRTADPVEQIRNRRSAFSQRIAWNGNAQVRWEGQHWGVGWSTRYFDWVAVDLPMYYLLQGGDRAPRAFNHDLNLNYRAPVVQDPRGVQRWLSGTSVSFGVRNVFDRAPRFWAIGLDRNIAPYDSIMGRSLWMQFRRDY